MVNQQLVDYIKKYKDQKVPKDQIKNELMSVGWQESDIDAAFIATVNPDIPLPPSASIPHSKMDGSVKEIIPPQSGSMWDAFEHILMFISLYTLAGAIVILLNYYVDRWLPNISYGTYYNNYSSSTDTYLVTSCLSAIIVAFPLFAYLFIRVSKKTALHPELRMLSSRKALIYFTLIVTFIIVLINIVSLVFSFLNGNVTLNFILHFIVYVGVSGSIFYYYLRQVKEDRMLYD